jgi:hypothetical protein
VLGAGEDDQQSTFIQSLCIAYEERLFLTYHITTGVGPLQATVARFLVKKCPGKKSKLTF